MLAANTLLNNRFRIIGELGRGGMGAVYEARDERLGSFVALKQNTSADPDTRRDFAREAKLLARLEHEAFPHVGDFFEDDAGRQYFVMQLVRGQDLGAALQQCGQPFAVAEVVRWAVQLLEALEVLHAYPVFHRDIKPSNIKLTPQGNIKLLDFGIAKGSAGGLTAPPTTMNFATKEYAPIEQILRANGEAYLMLLPINEAKVLAVSVQGTDARSDLYALGATLYHFLTGQPPSSASVRAATVWAGKQDSLLAPEHYNPSVPLEISRIVCCALALERAARYPAAAAMRRDFEDFQAAEVRLAAAAERRRIIEAERQRLHAEAEAERRRLQAEVETQRQAAAAAQRQVESLAAKLQEAAAQQQDETAKLREQAMLAEEEARQAIARQQAVAVARQHAEALAAQKQRETEAIRGQLTTQSDTPAPRHAPPVTAKMPLSEIWQPPAPEPPAIGSIPSPPASFQQRRIVITLAALGVLALGALGVQRLFRALSGNSSLSSYSFQTATLDKTGNLSARRDGVAQSYQEDLGGGVVLEMTAVPGGAFDMGSPPGERYHENDESPVHRINVPAFYLGRYEVTQDQWRAVAKLPKINLDLNPQPSGFQGAGKLPVESVSWHEAREFCARLTTKTNRAYRLPSEAEWEYAARAGTTTPFALGETITPDYVNYWGIYPYYPNATNKTHRASTLAVDAVALANAFGLYNMHGNVYEWCVDEYKSSYHKAPNDGRAVGKVDGVALSDATARVVRGGSWGDNAWVCRSADRNRLAPNVRDRNIGLRVAASAR